MAEPAPGEELGAVEAGDADGFLAAMLQRVKAERARRRRLPSAPITPKMPALLAQLVAVIGA